MAKLKKGNKKKGRKTVKVNERKTEEEEKKQLRLLGLNAKISNGM